MTHPLTIFVSGMIARHPHQGGATWVALQYVLGLRKLGHDVYLVEPIESDTLQPEGTAFHLSENARYFQGVVESFRLQDSASLVCGETNETVGLSYTALKDAARCADVLINIAGALQNEDLIARIPIRVYLDIDPGFTQLWQAQGIDMHFAGHTHFATIGHALGSAACAIPAGDIPWIKTNQPVALDYWPVVDHAVEPILTTVANWRGYGSVEYAGQKYGQKAHSIREFFPLPCLVEPRLCIAMEMHPDEDDDLMSLNKNDWELVEPLAVADTPVDYQRFIQNSWAEIGFAKSGYVASKCGWFSDRSICYLASGRPVVAQETGFSRIVPESDGLLYFSTLVEAVEKIDRLSTRYALHASGARRLAEEYFDSRLVLTRLLSAVGAAT